MDVLDFINRKGLKEIPNPEYNPKSKNNNVPRTISVLDVNSNDDPIIRMATEDFQNQYSVDSKFVDKYRNHGINWNPWENLDKQLAYSQSNWTKLGNGLAQAIVSEIGLGTIGAFADICDFVSSNILHLTEQDYQNPISSAIKEWQDEFNNEVAPVYVDPEVNIQNGGFSDVGWYAKNIPNIASTLMLLFPAKGISMVAGKLIRGSKLAKGIGNARRWATGIRKLEDASKMNKFQSAVNSFEGVARANMAVQISAEALLMRTAENYQESRETYIPVYEQATEQLNKLDDEQLQELVNKNPIFFDKNKVDITNRDELAKYIARSSADRTFTMDFSNILFDIFQLYALKNMGKGIKEVNRSRKVNKLQQESIEEAGKIKPLSAGTSTTSTATSAANAAESLTFMNKVGAYGKRVGGQIFDIGKYNAKVIAAELTEGVEEAVNYIALQEGLTYGKMLLAAQTDDYTTSSWDAMYKTWSAMNGNLGDYLMTPELQESAFWGLAGGFAFHYIGSAANKVQLAVERKAEAKARRENKKTGESTPLDDITRLFESDEDRVVRTIMNKRITNFETLRNKLKIIESGKDPYSEVDANNKFKEFTGNVEANKAIAKSRAISEFRSELAIDAVNSGTYELLKEYIKSDEVKQAMISLGLTNQQEVDSFVQETLNDMESAKEEYAKQSAFVLNQVAFVNNQKNKHKGKDENIGDENTDIPVEYARIIAKENYIRARMVKTIEQELSSLGVLEAEQEAILRELNPDINPITAKEAVALGGLLSTYRQLELNEREVKEQNPNNSIAKLQKFSLLEQIKSQKESVLKELKKRGIGGKVNAVANIFTAFSIAKRSAKNPNTNRIEEIIKATDEEILKDVRAFFGDEIGDVSDESIIQSAKAINKDINSIINNSSDGLINLNNKLFELYNHRTQLEIQKEIQRSLISSSADQILERINYHHNIENEVRLKKVAIAEHIVSKAIEEYNGITEETTGKDLIPAIVAAYQGDKSEARRIAEEVMANPGEGAVTASEFMDALDILAMHRKSNKLLFDWIVKRLDDKVNLAEQQRVRQIEENATNQQANTAPQNAQTVNPTQQTQQSTQQAPITPQSQSPTQTTFAQQTTQTQTKQPNTNVKLIINNSGQIVSAKTVSNDNSNNTFPAIENEDGTIEILSENIEKAKQLNLIKAGLFDVDENVDILGVGQQWQITENPIIKVKKNKPIQVVKTGSIISTNNSNNTVTAESTSESTSEVTEESTNTSTQEQNNTPINNENDSTPTTTSTPVENSVATDFSTGDGVYLEGELENLDYDVNSEIYSHIPNLLADDINFEDITSKAIAALTAKYPRIDSSIIETNVYVTIENIKAASESAKKFASKAMQTGATLAYNAKVEDAVDSTFSKPFESAAEAFLQEYSKLLIVKEIDGKQVVRLEDIMRLVKNAYPMSKAEAAAFYNIIRNYLIANQGRFEIIDLTDGEKIFDRLDKTSQEVIAEEYDTELRVNIRDFIEGNPGTEYLEELDKLKVGDKVTFVLDKNRIYVASNGKNIGYMSVPSVDGDAYIQINQGWVTDVKVDANGNPISETMDVIKHLFLDKNDSNDELRKLLTRLSVNPNNITEEDIEEFSMNPLIARLATQAKARKNNGNSRTILKVENDGTIDFGMPLLHLVRLWKYTNTSNISTKKEEIEDNIAINLVTFYNKLYNNYKALVNITGTEEAIVSKKSGTRVVRVMEDDTFNNYDQLPLAGEVIVDKNNSRISITNRNTANNITISGRPNNDQAGFTPGSTFLSMFGTDGSVDYIKAYGVKLSDSSMLNNTAFGKIGSAAFNHFETILHKLFTPNLGTINSTKELEDFLSNLVATDKSSNSIPLFRGIRGHFQIEPIAYKNNSASGIKLVYFEKGKTPVRFFIYNKTQYGKSFAYSVEDGNNSVKFTTTTKDLNENDVVRSCREALIKFLMPKVNINIDEKGIESDSLDNTNYDGFINRKNGKLVIDVPNANDPTNAVHEEFNSYNDYLIDNNLIRVNTKKSENGTNFERFGENQKANSNLFISLPTKTESAPSRAKVNSISENVKLEQGTNSEDYNSFVKTFNNEKVSGEQVLDVILDEESKKKLNEVTEEEGLHIADIFPQTIEFVEDFNDYGLNNIGSQPIAATSGNRSKFNLPVYKNGTRTSTTRRGANRTFVGPRFANMASSSFKARRYNAIKLLIHERIHNILQNKTDKSKTLLKELEGVYNEFVSLVKEDINNNSLSSEDKRILESFLKVYEKEFAKHKELVSKGKPDSFRHIEEFLVDSLTNGVLNNYLNSKYVENAKDNGKPENLLTKIIKAIAKFFGWTSPVDGSLFMKELNIIREFYNESNIKAIESNTSEEVIETTESNINEITEESNEEVTEEIEEDDLNLLDDDERLLLNNEDDMFFGNNDIDPFNATIEDTISQNYSSEIRSIKNKSIADGTFMKAPNGNPTNLNERQWLQVRTKAFKNWFGDWINNPAEASKVVDENGEPLVVYHNSNNEFTEFNPDKIGSATDLGFYGSGFYFTRHKDYASTYGKTTYEVFLNIRNPFIANSIETSQASIMFNREDDSLESYAGEAYSNYSNDIKSSDGVIHDGPAYYREGKHIQEYVAKNPNQVKSANSNIGEFSIEDNNIYNATIEDSYSSNDGFIEVGNIDAFGNQLPLSQQADYAALVARGIIETKCH